jgi:NAD(P)-dependent dehydrogenase (short-subunit alcohol dehydrogenase family)
MASTKLVAIIAGVGPGTGAAIARKFALSYPVVLLARNPDNFNSLVTEINGNNGTAIGISTDVSSAESVSNAFSEVEKKFGKGVGAAAAIFNASGGFHRKPFLELTEAQFTSGYDVSVRGAFLFSQAALPLLLKGAEQGSTHPPALIFTGATASVKSNAMMSSFSTIKYAVRALSASLAKEFGPKGVHVSHAVIDGVIDIPRTKEWMKDAGVDAKIKPEGIADAYWNLHTQPKSAFTWEIDIRPFVEKW